MNELLYRLEVFLKKQISRKRFFQICCATLLVFLTRSVLLKSIFAKSEVSSGRKKKGTRGDYDLVVTESGDPYKNTIEAIKKLGGMERFVSKGDTVVVKPNMAWDRSPQQAANTDPQVVAALVEMCYAAGAKRVNVFDIPCNDDRRVYEHSGIEKAAKEKGARVYFADHWNVVKASFPYKSKMEGWPIFRDAVKCDTFINVPVLKHHELAGLTLSMKNLMGVCAGVRGKIHLDIGEKLVDLTDFVNPDLTVIDATRVLRRNGPSGGDVKDVEFFGKVIAGTDPTLCDAYATQLFGEDPLKIPYIRNAVQRGFGSINIGAADIHTMAVS